MATNPTPRERQAHPHDRSVQAAAVTGLFGLAAVVLTAFFANTGGLSKILPGSPTETVTATVTRTVQVPTALGTGAESGGVFSEGKVRKSSGVDAVKLSSGYNIDLDNTESTSWKIDASGIQFGNTSADVGWNANTAFFKGPGLSIAEDYANETGMPSYTTCAHETAYRGADEGGVSRDDLKVGQAFCIRTTEKRYAAILIIAASSSEVDFSATVWDPQFS